MRNNFGTRPIGQWLDINAWNKNYPKFHACSPFEQEEIKRAIHEAASGIFLRVWEEVRSIFIKYLCNSESSSFMYILSAFARKKHQSAIGNLSHIHFLGKLKRQM